MKRIFTNSKDCELYQSASHQEAMVDSEAYNYIHDEVIWPGFKKYMKEHHNCDYDSLSALQVVRSYKHFEEFQKSVARYVPFKGRVLFWKVRDILEPDVWEFEAEDLAAGMIEWSALRRMSLLQLLRWHLKREDSQTTNSA